MGKEVGGGISSRQRFAVLQILHHAKGVLIWRTSFVPAFTQPFLSLRGVDCWLNKQTQGATSVRRVGQPFAIMTG